MLYGECGFFAALRMTLPILCKLLHMFLAVFNDAFCSFVDVLTRLKEAVVQFIEYFKVAPVRLAQNIAYGSKWLISNHRDDGGVDSIIHHCLLCFVGKLQRWHSGDDGGN